jgi:DNA-binding transcriptional ArsR family regulator
VHRRLEVLRDAQRQRLARAIAREPLTPTELARRSGMTVPQVSRHLARLREAGLVTADRAGRRTYYQLDLDTVRRIGEDLLTVLFRCLLRASDTAVTAQGLTTHAGGFVVDVDVYHWR